MSEFKGTPGPWEWWTSNSFLRLSSRATGKDGGVIDSYKMSDGHTSLSVKYEDMALIAAAPELLEACIRMRNQLYAAGYESKEKSLNPTEELLYQTEQAINKALGK
ncbi:MULTISPECIES: hypothetical protein [unclassified Citrobacter]|uniref:hypothetical protein n=1 Tax=unclassified Citrobacter TaxID=2644389 RepID=UPI001FF79F79|nr:MULTISPECIES: hypothetical protein [unclassified Citrobacter]